jgi:hypothetical protein
MWSLHSPSRCWLTGRPRADGLRPRLAFDVMHDMAIAFFIAFLAAVWLLGLPAYWLFFTSPGHRKVAIERLEWYRRQPLWPYGILKPLFVAFNAWVLFPVKGILVCLGVLIAFWFLAR